MSETVHIVHPFAPVYDEKSKILILGSFPSVKSREQNFYYGHPRNRFWQVIAALTGKEVPQTIAQKRELLLDSGIAVWDVIAQCTITGSSDSSIRDVQVNDFAQLLHAAPIHAIYANGGKAYELYRRYAQDQTGYSIQKLPSTSPANAACSLEKLCAQWGEILALPVHGAAATAEKSVQEPEN